jgi:hypothetical protein
MALTVNTPEFLDRANRSDGKVLCGDNGAPIAIDSISFVSVPSSKSGTDDFLNFEISGVATHSFVLPTNPGKGVEPLDSPLVVALARPAAEKDSSAFLVTLNKWLDLKEEDQLTDGDERWDRFEEDHPKSVVAALKAKGFFVRLGKKDDSQLVKAEQYGNPPWWMNQFIPPTRSADKSMFKKVKEMIKKHTKTEEASPF